MECHFITPNGVYVQGGSDMTGTDLCVQIVPVIFEPPCISVNMPVRWFYYLFNDAVISSDCIVSNNGMSY
jgi:hypothetical protein